ncbi:hypothetical protein [Flavobacterium litorale]|uniref:DUF3575 domain-containing protein n=1 Tax=Flavobacterium litorale TaxID=2856519 RepID=A0ABX8VDW7_9FLAO|nr:hypothetical protein [Flavobacterium litorale]QYJ68844.1 hypothetical protein K1I41_02890 [Flavobacterium litorale]
MKKIVLLTLMAFGLGGYAQTETDTTRVTILERKHEVKLGAVKLLAGPIFEGTYEYIHTRDFTFGSSVLYSFIDGEDYPENFSITPFARFYFQESKEYGAQGFFVEGFLKYVNGTDFDNRYFPEDNSYRDVERDFNTAAVGLSLGKKWINNTGFVFEILIGGGRNFAGDDFAPDAVFRGDFNIGYRF